jgi:hypothetical protein
MTNIEHASVCTLDCPDTCSLTVTIDGGRIVKVRGSAALPLTAGVICNKVAHHTVSFVHGPRRLTHPLRRIGPKGASTFERISLASRARPDHARCNRRGPLGREAVMPLSFSRPHGMLAMDGISVRFPQAQRHAASALHVRNRPQRELSGTYGAAAGIGPELRPVP